VPETPPSLLVVSAHAGDFVWRAGGAIAAAVLRGERATVVCLSYGERGESASQWLQGKPLDEIKAIRRDEATAAASALGAEIEFLDAGTTRSSNRARSSRRWWTSTVACSRPSC